MFSWQAIVFVLQFYCASVTVESKSENNSVKVSLYYESLCPYCREFVKNQLYPTFEAIGDVISLDLVPFGNAKEQHNKNGKWKFTCQHGPKECYVNKLQACVLGQNTTQAKNMQFVGCIMSLENPERNENAQKCCEKADVSWNKIKSCVDTDKGNELFSHYGKITKNLVPKLQYVPHIRFNDVFNETVENEARDDLLETLCGMLAEKPNGCNT